MNTVNDINTLSCQRKPEIDYPCLWQYKIIGDDKQQTREAIVAVCDPLPVTITFSHSSSGGKYHSFSAEIEVGNEEARLAIYNALQNHSAIKVVL